MSEQAPTMADVLQECISALDYVATTPNLGSKERSAAKSASDQARAALGAADEGRVQVELDPEELELLDTALHTYLYDAEEPPSRSIKDECRALIAKLRGPRLSATRARRTLR